MSTGDEKKNKKRFFITLSTAFCLFLLPYLKIPENSYFIVPLVAEGIAYGILIIWRGHKERAASNKKKGATQKLNESLEIHINIIKDEIRSTEDPLICSVLQKQLLSLYEERSNDSSKQRTKLRGDIEKYEEEEKLQKAEKDFIKQEVIKKAEEEFEKLNQQN